MSYIARQIDLQFQLAQGSFAAGGNTVTLSGLRVDAQITNVTFPGQGTLTARIFGMTPSDMNALTVGGLQYATAVNKNTVTVSAGDAQAGMTQVFTGTIYEAFPDFTAAPDVPMVISAIGINNTLKPMVATSFNGSVSAATIFKQLAGEAGLIYQGEVTGTLVNPYFWGTLPQQITQAAQALNVYAYIDQPASKLVVWPKGGSQTGGSTPLIAPPPQGGMIGYPSFQALYIRVRTLFDPNIQLGGLVQVQSSLPAATGTFTVIPPLNYFLSSVDYNDGPWETVVTCTPQNVPA